MLEDRELGAVVEEVAHERESAGDGRLGRRLRRDVPPDVPASATTTSGAASRRSPRSRWPRSSRARRSSTAPCGFGRHAIPLAEAGYLVTGLDRSQTQLAEAERRRGEAEWPRLVRGDYRQLPFEDASFDAVLTLFSSLGYLERDEDVGVLRELRRVLRPGAHARRRDGTPRRVCALRAWQLAHVGPAPGRLALPRGAHAGLGRPGRSTRTA